MRTLKALVLALAACGGASSSSTVHTPVTQSPATAVVRCERAPAAQPPAGANRRIELSLEAAPGAAEVTVDGSSRLSTQAGGAAGCGYVELAPGAHKVTLRAEGNGGLGVRFGVATENPKQPYWYDVFSISCGLPGPCAREDLVTWRNAIQQNRTTITDPCSAMQLRDVHWESERLPGGDQVSRLDLSFTIFIYQESFDKAPRDPSCPTS